MIRVSVVIPTFNRGELVCQAVASVLSQDVQDLEVVVIDDGSIDGTGDLIRGTFKDERRVRYIWQDHSERAVARNRGIRASEGEYIAFLDSDDSWLPTKLEKQLALFRANPNLVMVHTGYAFIDHRGHRVGDAVALNQESVVRGRIYWSMLYSNRVGSPTPLVARRVFERAGLFSEDRTLLCFEDWEMWMRLCYRGLTDYVPEPLALHRRHVGNTERPLTAGIYRALVAHALTYVIEADQARVRRIAARRFADLAFEAASRNGRGAALEVLRTAMTGIGPTCTVGALVGRPIALFEAVFGASCANALRAVLKCNRNPAILTKGARSRTR